MNIAALFFILVFYLLIERFFPDYIKKTTIEEYFIDLLRDVENLECDKDFKYMVNNRPRNWIYTIDTTDQDELD